MADAPPKRPEPSFPSTGPRKCIRVPDITEVPAYALDAFSIPLHYQEDLESVLIPSGLIQARIEKLAEDIFADYDGAMIHMLCCLKGGAGFFSDLIMYLKRCYSRRTPTVPFTFDFIRVSSYKGTESGDVKVTAVGMDFEQLKGKHVLLVEDIVDTGRTMAALLPELQKHGPSTLRVCSLLQKRLDNSANFIVDYLGFSVPNHFVVGYCLDYEEYFRDMDHICLLDTKCLPKYDALAMSYK
ncbi:phosphoribosyltransferase domain-containing protein 1 [Pavlovales sp. CCMP2436]|nr:phosphoribosyltransferase domain-containing protein 1 [Pavlovales sp. CCMP2436]|eukprot:CAMPEP_0179867060 /NCGR_PEP_ID=MMETSP0982-20121206/17905_1 /TAXON_ID=483367 /ORGANISM="non described non described, Strain CCMP 2436" /LENGTH=240 /DNA_ID=CAMNT_0021756267 /DNA_START=61 /DNA_END=783 /DNA_ORIENTATION=+